MFFDGGAFWGTPLSLLLSSQKCQGVTFFHDLSKEPVRFDSLRFLTFLRTFIGSVRFGQIMFRFDAVRPAFFGRVVARSGSVRFVSTSGSGRFQN